MSNAPAAVNRANRAIVYMVRLRVERTVSKTEGIFDADHRWRYSARGSSPSTFAALWAQETAANRKIDGAYTAHPRRSIGSVHVEQHRNGGCPRPAEPDRSRLRWLGARRSPDLRQLVDTRRP